MDSDQQDFLERKEARLRRVQRSQQEAAASRSLPRGGKGQPGSVPQTQKPPFPRRKSAGSGVAGQVEQQASAQPQKASPAQKPAAQPASTSAERQEASLAGGLAGRRAAARRERQASVRPSSNEPKPSLLARLIVWGTMAICGLLVLATLGEVWTVHQLRQQVNADQQAANQLQNQNRALATQIARLQQPETIEYEARQLGYIYPGDQPVVVETTQPAPRTTAQQSTRPQNQNGWGFWPDWLRLFLGG